MIGTRHANHQKKKKKNPKVLWQNPMISCLYHFETLYNFRNILVSDTYWKIYNQYVRKVFFLHKINFEYQTIQIMYK